MNKFKFYIVIFLILASCAVQQPPSGGPPDKTPPVITDAFPKNHTLNYKRDYAQFRFSKYMNKSSVIENLFVSPNKKFDYDWSGKDLEISFKEPMDSNTTYSITLGTDYSDLKGNKPETAYSLIFSTGNKIDSGSIRGILLNKKSEGVYIFAYYLGDKNPDTLDPRHTKAEYKTQVGSRGTFEIVALKPGKYRVFAINDVFKDGVYDEGVDDFGTTLTDLNVTELPVEDLRLKAGPAVDKKGPVIYGVQPVASKHIIIDFSKALDSATVQKNNFKIEDTAHSKTIEINSVFLSNGFANKVELFTNQKLDSSTKWLLTCNKNNTSGLRDSTGYLIADSNSTFRFFGTNESERIQTKFISSKFRDSAINQPIEGITDLIFSNSVSKIFDSSFVTYRQIGSNDSISFHVSYPQENIIRISPLKKLNPDSWYSVIVDTRLKTDDSTIKLHFKTADNRNNGSLYGKIIDTSGYSGQYIMTLYSKETNEKFRIITKNRDFVFESVTPGSYIFEISSDSNNNSKYDFGNAYPWEPAEKILVLPKEINIKLRWKFEDFKVIYNGK